MAAKGQPPGRIALVRQVRHNRPELAGLIAGLFAARTALEDRCLRAEFPGYGEYAAATRSKLIPGLW
jgi:protein-S-isoprenylcysteine O-methyltransferase Ste14